MLFRLLPGTNSSRNSHSLCRPVPARLYHLQVAAAWPGTLGPDGPDPVLPFPFRLCGLGPWACASAFLSFQAPDFNLGI